MLPVGRKAASRPALPSVSSLSTSTRAAATPSSQRQPQPRGTGPQPHLGTQGRPSKDQSHSHSTKPPQGSSADKRAPSRPPLARRQHWPSPPQHGVPAGLPGPAPPARAFQGREAASGCPPATSLSRDTVQSGPPRPAPRQAAEPAVGSDTAQQAARAWQLRVQSGTAASTSYTATPAHGQARYGNHRPVPEQGSPQSTAAAHSKLHPINLAGTSMSQRQQGITQSQPSNSQGSNMQRPQPLVPVPAPLAADVRGLSSRQHARTQAAPSQEAPARAASAVRMRVSEVAITGLLMSKLLLLHQCSHSGSSSSDKGSCRALAHNLGVCRADQASHCPLQAPSHLTRPMTAGPGCKTDNSRPCCAPLQRHPNHLPPPRISTRSPSSLCPITLDQPHCPAKASMSSQLPSAHHHGPAMVQIKQQLPRSSLQPGYPPPHTPQ